MAGDLLYDFTVVFSLVTGTAAGLLSLLTWETLRRSPFGRAILVLSLAMVAFILYHVLLLVWPTNSPFVQLFKSAMFTGVCLFIWMVIWSQHRLRTSPVPGRDLR